MFQQEVCGSLPFSRVPSAVCHTGLGDIASSWDPYCDLVRYMPLGRTVPDTGFILSPDWSLGIDSWRNLSQRCTGVCSVSSQNETHGRSSVLQGTQQLASRQGENLVGEHKPLLCHLEELQFHFRAAHPPGNCNWKQHLLWGHRVCAHIITERLSVGVGLVTQACLCRKQGSVFSGKLLLHPAAVASDSAQWESQEKQFYEVHRHS